VPNRVAGNCPSNPPRPPHHGATELAEVTGRQVPQPTSLQPARAQAIFSAQAGWQPYIIGPVRMKGGAETTLSIRVSTFQ